MLCSVLSVFADDRTFAALPVALLAALAYALERAPLAARHPFVGLLTEALLAGAAATATGGAVSPMLPYLLAPGLCAGLTATRLQVAVVSAASVAGLVLGRLLAPLLGRPTGPLLDLAREAGQWVGLGLALGLVAHWAQLLSAAEPVSPQQRYHELRELLGELRALTRRLPGGLDVHVAAEALLQHCAEVAPSQRSAVLLRRGGGQALVPAAVRGTRRVPWRAPLSEPGPLQRTWDTARSVVDRRPPDVHGKRRGSSLAVVPLLSRGDEPFGLVILESFDVEAFDDAVVALLEECVAQGGPRLETAVLFEEVRSAVTVEERDRLAREMHDGVAQELAYVGYQLDDLRTQAARVDAGLAEAIGGVRKGLTGLISDIRLSITDLKTSVSSDRGLGTAVSSYVRAVGSGQRVTVHLSLQESAFRLPGEQEVLLFQVVQAVAQDVRRSGLVDNLWVTLEVHPPSARLRLEHDGPVQSLDGPDLSAYAEQVSRLGGTLRTYARPVSGLVVEAVLEGGGSGDPGAPGR